MKRQRSLPGAAFSCFSTGQEGNGRFQPQFGKPAMNIREDNIYARQCVHVRPMFEMYAEPGSSFGDISDGFIAGSSACSDLRNLVMEPPPVFLAWSGRTGLLKNGINPSRLQEKSVEMQFHIDRREESLYNYDANGVPCGGVFFGNEMERDGSCKLSGQPVFRARAGHGPAQACGAAVWRSTALNGARPVFRSPLPTGERWPIPRKMRGRAGIYFGLTCAGWAANPFCPVKYNKK